MPAPSTIDDFLAVVRKSGVVEEETLTTFLKSQSAAEPTALADAMVRAGLLTPFHTGLLLEGKAKGFSIGKFKVLDRLGSGAMAQVFLCERRESGERVAVKVLPSASAKDESLVKRFEREARATAVLDHRNLVRAYEIDQDGKLHFLVMEYVEGAILQDMVNKHGPLAIERAAHYCSQAALGLQHAHEQGLVHRDIKPENLIVDRSGTVKILDMGLARFFNDVDDVLTQGILGTPDYLAPEQTKDSHEVDIRADIYGLGCTMYFVLTGRTPFGEGSVAQKLLWHQTKQPKPIRELRPEVPERLAKIVEKMMAKEPAQRFQTPALIAQALVPWTKTPISPPPEKEMPRLSLAHQGSAPTATDLSTTPMMGSRPVPSELVHRRNAAPSGTDLSMTPRAGVRPVSPDPTPRDRASRTGTDLSADARTNPGSPAAAARPTPAVKPAPAPEPKAAPAPKPAAVEPPPPLRVEPPPPLTAKAPPPAKAPPSVMPDKPTAAVRTTPNQPSETAPAPRSSVLPWVVVGLILVGGAAAAGWVFMRPA